MTSTLSAGGELPAGGELRSDNGRVRLVLQEDGNLVLYRVDTGKPLWATMSLKWPNGSGRTPGKVTIVKMQTDGNFVGYDNQGKPQWASDTDGNSGAHVVLQDDGNLVVYAGPHALWAAGTVQDWSPTKAETGNRRLAEGRWMNTTASVSPDGLITGTTTIWSTAELYGFHGSAVPVILDSQDKILWPTNINAEKHQYGVDGTMVPFGAASKRVEHWNNKIDPALLNQGRLSIIQWWDPKPFDEKNIQAVGKKVQAFVTEVGTVWKIVAAFL
ncbi:hypothetical protein [Actinacidiphila glaucinigra]|uniref:D-mannose binding lectin n=1 Tax=Actinacidiphila glaucinigra TaxID=235986 RepID=A0A239NN18_9ACTN|nr:hypothetical protein [Actinacidiphila glaucinigra]SNT56307.1 D-mannose binding lectin [Actinacidiphila glaucinigra]